MYSLTRLQHWNDRSPDFPFGKSICFWETDFYTPSVLGGAALLAIQRQRCIKILCPNDPDFYTPLAPNCLKGHYLPAPEVYKHQSPNFGASLCCADTQNYGQQINENQHATGRTNTPRPRVCKRWSPNGGSSFVGERSSPPPFLPQCYLFFTSIFTSVYPLLSRNLEPRFGNHGLQTYGKKHTHTHQTLRIYDSIMFMFHPCFLYPKKVL